MLLLVVLVLSGLELYRKECMSEKGVDENEWVEAGEEERRRAYLDPSKHTHASTHHHNHYTELPSSCFDA